MAALGADRQLLQLHALTTSDAFGRGSIESADPVIEHRSRRHHQLLASRTKVPARLHSSVGRSVGSALLRLLDCPFDFLCPSCIELLFIWSQLVEKSQELSRVTEFFTGDVHKHRDGELVVR